MTADTPQTANATHRPPAINQAWLDQQSEPIIDPHHQLWARETQNYLKNEALADFGGGYRTAARIYRLEIASRRGHTT
jgi:hypothetical protein